MQNDMECSRRIKIETESKASRLQEENQKLYTNYEVLKEHELNIIKDFQEKKISDK